MAQFDPTVPSIARVCDFFPGGKDNFAAFSGSLELVPPGAVDARQWHPGWEDAASLRKRDGHVLAAVAGIPR